MPETLQSPDNSIPYILDSVFRRNQKLLNNTAIAHAQAERVGCITVGLISEWELEPIDNSSIDSLHQRVGLYALKRDLLTCLRELSETCQDDEVIEVVYTGCAEKEKDSGKVEPEQELLVPKWDTYYLAGEAVDNTGVEFRFSREAGDSDGTNYEYLCYFGIDGEFYVVNLGGGEVTSKSISEIMKGLTFMSDLALQEN